MRGVFEGTFILTQGEGTRFRFASVNSETKLIDKILHRAKVHDMITLGEHTAQLLGASRAIVSSRAAKGVAFSTPFFFSYRFI